MELCFEVPACGAGFRGVQGATVRGGTALYKNLKCLPHSS